VSELVEEKILCINCGKDAYWCGSKPDEDGHLHDCHQISCDHCQMQFDFLNDELHEAETFDEMRVGVRKVYRGFALSALECKDKVVKELVSQWKEKRTTKPFTDDYEQGCCDTFADCSKELQQALQEQE